LRVLFSFIILSVLLACVRRTAAGNAVENAAGDATGNAMVGDVVKELADSLWYVFQDREDRYWFGSDGDGVFCYDGKSIVNYTTKHGLPNDRIRQIQQDALGNMYFSTLNGICKFDGKTFVVLQPVRTKEWKSEPSDMWFYMLGKGGEHGPYRYDGKTLYSLEFPKHFLHDEFMEGGINSFFSPYEIYTIYKDRKGVMWFGTSVFGACRYDGESVKWMYERDLTIVPAGGSFGIRSIYEDRDGRFWICNTKQRFEFDLEKTKASDRLEYEKVAGIGDSKLFGGDEFIYYSHIVEDDDGNIWLTTWSQGVYKYDGSKITHYKVTAGGKDVNLVSMYKDRHGVLWLGTIDSGVFRFDGERFGNKIIGE